MRIAPIGVFYHNNLIKLREVAYKSSQITHAHRLGKEGAALQAYAIAQAVSLGQQEALEQASFLAKLISYTSEETYREKLNRIGALLACQDRGRVITELGNGVEAFNSVPTAIYCFLSHPRSFAQAVLYAISLGGDTDTIAAMTGAISGAYLGLDSIPSRWKDKLENREYIQELAEKLWLRFIQG
jgi:poly(ADP-ribose) glycohydrolase ARH3